jgi:hypothetical protein
VTVGWAAAIALGVVLLLSGALKLTGWRVWRAQARELAVPDAIVIGIPVLELVIGVLLVVDVGRPVTAVVAAVLLTGFTAVLVRLLLDGQRPPCACFGALSRRPIGWGSVVRNGVLLALAIVAALVS